MFFGSVVAKLDVTERTCVIRFSAEVPFWGGVLTDTIRDGTRNLKGWMVSVSYGRSRRSRFWKPNLDGHREKKANLKLFRARTILTKGLNNLAIIQLVIYH